MHAAAGALKGCRDLQRRRDRDHRIGLTSDVESGAMNSLNFDFLKEQITVRLHAHGPATSERLASELAVPHRNVRFALEQLKRKEECVRLLPFGLWDVTDDVTQKSA